MPCFIRQDKLKGIIISQNKLITTNCFEIKDYQFPIIYYITSSLREFIAIDELDNMEILKFQEEEKKESTKDEKLKENKYIENIEKNLLFNPSQLKAIKMSNNLGKYGKLLIQGPPGTGKTKTLIGIVSVFLLKKIKILICAPSNDAVDLIFKSLEKGVYDENLNRTNPQFYRFRGKNIKDEFISNDKEKEDNSFYDIESKCNAANIILTTLNSAGDNIIKDLKDEFVLIVDEAAQTNYANSIIPLLCNIKYLILIGDHKQLPPTIKNKDLINSNYAKSLFENLINKQNIKKVMLDTQYRMNKKISQFISTTFYKNLLKDSDEIKQNYYFHFIFSFIQYQYSFSVILVGSKGCNELNINEVTEIFNFVSLLKEYIKDSYASFKPEISIGIITPYSKQKNALLYKFQSFKNIDLLKITINTIDSFQGSECDIIIFSLVRSYLNSFIINPNRINVAISRAKYCLFIFGNPSLFQNKVFQGNNNIYYKLRDYSLSVRSSSEIKELIFINKKEIYNNFFKFN